MLVAATQLVSWKFLGSEDSETSLYSCRAALSMTERLLGPTSPDPAASMFNLATANMLLGDFGKGTEALIKRAVQIYDIQTIETGDSLIHAEARKNGLRKLAEVYLARSARLANKMLYFIYSLNMLYMHGNPGKTTRLQGKYCKESSTSSTFVRSKEQIFLRF